MRRLAALYPDAMIAGILNRQGRTTARGHRFEASRVGNLRRHWLVGVFRLWHAVFRAYQAVDHHVQDRVRHFLARRHKAPGRGARRFSRTEVFGELGVLRLHTQAA